MFLYFAFSIFLSFVSNETCSSVLYALPRIACNPTAVAPGNIVCSGICAADIFIRSQKWRTMGTMGERVRTVDDEGVHRQTHIVVTRCERRERNTCTFRADTWKRFASISQLALGTILMRATVTMEGESSIRCVIVENI